MNGFLFKNNIVEQDKSLEPRHLIVASIISAIMTWIFLFAYSGYKTYTIIAETGFNIGTFASILGVMAITMLSMAFIVGLLLVFSSRGISKLLKIRNESVTWFVAFIVGVLWGVVLGAITGGGLNYIYAVFFGLSSLWGASFLSFYSEKYVKKSKLSTDNVTVNELGEKTINNMKSITNMKNKFNGEKIKATNDAKEHLELDKI